MSISRASLVVLPLRRSAGVLYARSLDSVNRHCVERALVETNGNVPIYRPKLSSLYIIFSGECDGRLVAILTAEDDLETAGLFVSASLWIS